MLVLSQATFLPHKILIQTSDFKDAIACAMLFGKYGMQYNSLGFGKPHNL
ncbi:hypothetical protein [Calothrix sp. NIES-2098]